MRIHALALLLLAVFTVPAFGGAKPMAIVSSSPASDLERDLIKYYVAAPLGAVWVETAEWLNPAEFSQYSIVVWLREAPRRLQADELEDLRQYLEAGGQILMTNGVPMSLFGRPFPDLPWLRTKGWAYNRESWKPELLAPDHPYLEDMNPQGKAWLATPHALTGFQGINLLGKPDQWTVLGYVDVGKGRLLFSSYGPSYWRDEITKADVGGIYRKIVQAADPLREDQQAAELLKAAPGRLALWRRDWEWSVADRLIWQPCGPRPRDLIDRLEFVSCRDEVDTAFFCIQSAEALGAVSIRTSPLLDSTGQTAACGKITTLVMGREPKAEVPVPESYQPVDPDQRGPFFLVPPEKLAPEGQPAVHLARFEPRTVWVQVETRGLAAGEYAGRVEFLDSAGSLLAALPMKITVAAIRMPAPRLVNLRTWGGSIQDDPRLVREMHRQGCDAGVISYPDLARLYLLNTETTLAEALRNPKVLRDRRPFPRLDFTRVYRDHLNLHLQYGLTYLMLKDVRTGVFWADALTGRTCDVTKPFDEWPADWREAYVDYYAQLMQFCAERGYPMVYPSWTDEPSFADIQTGYLPRAKAYMAAGMGPGSNWTTPGWMTAEMVNTFAPWTRDFGMYQYGFPNFQRFLREGKVKLPPKSTVGFVRGGTGLAVRLPHHESRVLGWQVVHQGEPAEFLRTGPIWKGWLYYVDFTRMAWFRLGGVQGERLLAYGSTDPGDMAVDMLSSSDWEGARDGVDDANLAKMFDWYLPRLKARAQGPWKERLSAMEAERTTWFTPVGPLPIGTRPVHYHHEPKDGPVLDYRIEMATAKSTEDLERAKRYVMGLLQEMAPHVQPDDIEVSWNGVPVVRAGQPAAAVVVSPTASEAVKRTARSIVDHVAQQTGVRLPLSESDADKVSDGWTILVAAAGDAPARRLCQAHCVQLDERYPGKGDYRTVRLDDLRTIAVLGADDAGVMVGVRNWLSFVSAKGNWLR
ncbi:MAG: hypothetical protein HUU20_17040 [Pirellulales bacterium]|nr:hypothetical protein [Pirellulales bacterium]